VAGGLPHVMRRLRARLPHRRNRARGAGLPEGERERWRGRLSVVSLSGSSPFAAPPATSRQAPDALRSRRARRSTGPSGRPWPTRRRALLLLTAVYLALNLVPLTDGWAGIPPTSPWSSLPHYGVQGILLLLGALGFGLTELTAERARS
jgi:hypothetical protein